MDKIEINIPSISMRLLTLFLVLSKLDGTMEITWMIAFLPIFISYLIPILAEIVCYIITLIKNFKANNKYNASKPGNGNPLYWDAANKRMYTPFETKGDDNDV